MTSRSEEVLPEHIQETDTSATMTIYSGLSALIQAATSQLGHSNGQVDHFDNEGIIEEGYKQDGDLSSQSDEVVSGSFPGKLMTLLLDPENIDIITFLPDGTYFAVRSKEFSQGLMRQQFPALDTFKDFLELVQQWGFTRVCDARTEDESRAEEDGIQVFRHPHFNRNKTEGLFKMKFGENPTEARMSAIPETLSRIQLSSPSTNNVKSDVFSSKRRLSVSHTERGTEDSIIKSHRVSEGEISMPEGESIARTLSSGNDSETPGRRRSSTTDIRSYVTAELDIQSGESEDGTEASPPRDASVTTAAATKAGSASLVQGGVERATQTIVTDAIETLLFDEGHTRETYLKHERELSKSSLPGVVPISKQLFSRSEGVANVISSMAERNEAEASTSLPKEGNGQ